jgi:hypothetical protein
MGNKSKRSLPNDHASKRKAALIPRSELLSQEFESSPVLFLWIVDYQDPFGEVCLFSLIVVVLHAGTFQVGCAWLLIPPYYPALHDFLPKRRGILKCDWQALQASKAQIFSP